MYSFKTLILAAALVMLSSSVVYGKSCSKSSDEGDECTLDAQLAHPTQFVLGYQEVRSKTEKFNDMSKSDLDDYLKDHPVPCVKGPNGIFYMTDHHHLTAALLLSDVDDDRKVINVQVQNDLSSYLTMSDFWSAMTARGFVWLYDEKGNAPLNPTYLPTSVVALANDPYRSLAYNVRHAGGYNKVEEDFQDFLWVNFFRENNVLQLDKAVDNADGSQWQFCDAAPFSVLCLGGVGQEDEILASHLPAALTLAKSKQASNLPGFIGGGSEALEEKNDASASASANTVVPTDSRGSRGKWTILFIGAGIALLTIAIVLTKTRKRSSSSPVEMSTPLAPVATESSIV